MASDPKLVVALEARLNKFESDLKAAGVIADRQVKAIEDKFSQSNPAAGFISSFAKGAVAAFSLDRAIHLVINSISDMAKIGDVSARVGISPEQLQEISFALQQSGGEASQAADGMEKFANNLAKAANGEGNLTKFLAQNNVSLRDRNGVLRPTADLLADVANLIQNAATPQQRLNIAVEFFGKSAGPAMASALANGALGLQALGAQAQQSGAVIQNELINKAKEIDDRWNAVARTFSTTVKSAIIQLVDAAERLTNLSVIAAALDSGTLSMQQLAQAIAVARSKGSPVDPSWIKELDRLIELQREANKGRVGLTAPSGSSLPGAPNNGVPTNTKALGGATTKDAFERAIELAEKHTAVTEAETAAIDLNAGARARAKLVAELETAAKEANTAAGLKNTEVTAAQRAEIDRIADSYQNAAQKAADANNPLRSFARESSNVELQLQNAGVNGLRSFEDALISIGTGAKTAQQAFKEMAAAILQDLARIAIRKGITGPLSTFFDTLSLTPKAAGGPVSANTPYLVGEQGPELFVPKGAGSIVPNNMVSKSGMGGSNVTLATSIDARGSTMTEARLHQILNVRDAQVKSQIVPIMRQAQSRKMA